MLGLLVALAGAVVLVLALTKETKFSYYQAKFTAEFGNNFDMMNTLELKQDYSLAPITFCLLVGSAASSSLSLTKRFSPLSSQPPCNWAR